MDLNIIGASAVGLAVLASGSVTSVPATGNSLDTFVGKHLYASVVPVLRYGDTTRTEDLSLEDLGTVAGIVEGKNGVAPHVVAVGGVWGIGAREVEVDMDRVRVVEGEDGARLVVDLSV